MVIFENGAEVVDDNLGRQRWAHLANAVDDDTLTIAM
jgi:hypothetical protein